MFEGVRKIDAQDKDTAGQPVPPASSAPQTSPGSGLRPKLPGATIPDAAAQGDKDIPPETLHALRRAGMDAIEDEGPSGRLMIFLIGAAVLLVGGIVGVLLFANPFRGRENSNTPLANANTNAAVIGNQNTTANTNAVGNSNQNTNTSSWLTYTSTLFDFTVSYPPSWQVDRAQSTDAMVVFKTGTGQTTQESITAAETTQSLTEWQNLLLVTKADATAIDTSALRIAGFTTAGVATNTTEGTLLALTTGRMRYVFQTGGAMLENGMLNTFQLLSAPGINANTNTTVNANTNTNTNTGANIDTDRDGLSDAQEETLGTNSLVADTDRDDLADYQEVIIYNSDPLDPDTDGDGYTDGQEVKNNYNPIGPGNLTPP